MFLIREAYEGFNAETLRTRRAAKNFSHGWTRIDMDFFCRERAQRKQTPFFASDGEKVAGGRMR